VNQLVRVYVAQKRKISEGDKLAGRHGNKGVISKILPIEDMPYMADGTPIDIVLNPLGVPSRMNVGQVLEAHLGYVARHGWEGQNKRPAEPRKTRTITEPAVWIASPVFDGAHWDETEEASAIGTIQRLFETLNDDSQSMLTLPANGNGADASVTVAAPLTNETATEGDDAAIGIAPVAPAPEAVAPAPAPVPVGEREPNRLVDINGKATLYDGRTGEPYDRPVTVGYMYILKLSHLVDDKIHARSTGPYSMITQQPLGGKAQFGGQRFGEMEVWALEAYGSAYALQEILTIKSDDVLGRVKVYEAIVKGENIPEPGIPESFKVLIKEMQALCLNVRVMNAAGEEIEIRELDEDAFRTTESLGIDLSRPERGTDEEDAARARSNF
jgi:DNA-directed RNA polymerase subunit beta